MGRSDGQKDLKENTLSHGPSTREKGIITIIIIIRKIILIVITPWDLGVILRQAHLEMRDDDGYPRT
jgi:hypothetical protein